MSDSLTHVLRLIEEGKVPQTALGISDEWMQQRYATAYDHFSEKRYEEAALIFSHLAALNPGIKDYWLSLAMAQLRCHSWEMALTSLAMTSILHPRDPQPHYYSGLCHISLDRTEAAKESFELVAQLSQDDQTHARWALEANQWLEKLR